MNRNFRDFKKPKNEVPPPGALVSAKIYDPRFGACVSKAFVLVSEEEPQISLFTTLSVYLLSTHTAQTIFANQIIEVLSYPA